MTCIKTYEQAADYLGDRQSRKLSSIRSTELQRYGPVIALQYHGTTVVTYFPDGKFHLNTGGYRTSTTKSRINEFSPARVWQHKYSWYIGELPTRNIQPFRDGLVINSEGEIIDG